MIEKLLDSAYKARGRMMLASMRYRLQRSLYKKLLRQLKVQTGHSLHTCAMLVRTYKPKGK